MDSRRSHGRVVAQPKGRSGRVYKVLITRLWWLDCASHTLQPTLLLEHVVPSGLTGCQWLLFSDDAEGQIANRFPGGENWGKLYDIDQD